MNVKFREFYWSRYLSFIVQVTFYPQFFLLLRVGNQNNVVFKLSSNWKEQWKRKRISEKGGIFENSIE